MAYSTATPPMEYIGPVNGPRVWAYTSADAQATVAAANYFTNGAVLGMRDGDLAFVYNTTGTIWSIHKVAVAASVVTLSAGTAIT